MILLSYFEPETNSWQQTTATQLPSHVTTVLPADARLWINLNDANAAEIQQVLQHFAIAPTLAEDFSRQRHPPKLEAQPEFSLLIMRGYADADFAEYSGSAQVNLLYSKQILISRMHCHNPHLLQQLEPQLSNGTPGAIADWVKQLILAVSASYLEKLINFEDEQSELEDVMLHRGNDEYMSRIMRYRSVLRKINRNLAYQKDIFSDAMYEEQSPLLRHFSTADIRDFYEKFERLHSMTDLYYDQLSDLVEGYLSTTSHQINERMKVLTIVSTIFIPLTFVAGIYGMNFIYMPELQMPNGYFMVLIAMALGGIGGLIWFKIRGWW
ncbi:magnesium transporter CorA family protein [Rheinheimera sp. YQF-2]|uniref:Magnesium transporter CorA family protein n=1 Tax=Rheinheimera lutimaris TaxID=2740584 RepID=A0A7Y5ANP4_9GAMM|nr:magnesium transporter CorA family protein [Rheinheimera lutimaris]NRQ41274.1 magnesium transporter CorA family protein [Rheinheimera lutimaris]